MSKSVYGFYQASIPGSFAIFSFLSIWIIGRFGTEKTKYAGVAIFVVGVLLLRGVAFFSPEPLLICASVVLATVGISISAAIYGMQSANVYPEMRGIASGMSNSLRHLIVAGIVALGSHFFNGTINPVSNFMSLCAAIVLVLVLALAARS